MRPSDMPSMKPSEPPSLVPSDHPSFYPTWVSESKVRCPNAQLKRRLNVAAPYWCATACKTFKRGMCYLVYPQCYPL